MTKIKMQFELTDTFGGESNYSWVRRHEVEVPSDISRRSAVTMAKKWAGWTGFRCDTWDFGDLYDIRPHGICQVLFVTFGEEVV